MATQTNLEKIIEDRKEEERQKEIESGIRLAPLKHVLDTEGMSLEEMDTDGNGIYDGCEGEAYNSMSPEEKQVIDAVINENACNAQFLVDKNIERAAEEEQERIQQEQEEKEQHQKKLELIEQENQKDVTIHFDSTAITVIGFVCVTIIAIVFLKLRYSKR